MVKTVLTKKNKLVGTTSSKKRKRSTSYDDEHDQVKPVVVKALEPGRAESNSSSKLNDTNKITVPVPSNLSAKDAKKFRKDARRKARRDGKDVVFIVDEINGNKAQDPEEDGTETPVDPLPNKKKRKFPSIKELLALEQQKQEADAKRQKSRSNESNDTNLSDEYKARYVAIDCEMVGIGPSAKQSALARVSCTDWDGNVLLDSFVRVPGKVTDFRTWVSGVKPKHLQSDDAMDIKQCRDKVTLLLSGKILVGHAVKNDLDALLLSHPKEHIRDTSKYRPFQRLHNKKWLPRKLRDLVKEYCDITIQASGESHSSVDDAKATMELFKAVHSEWEKELLLKSLKQKK